MHRAEHYLSGLLPVNANKATVLARVLTPQEAAIVSTALPVDANDYFYSACMSVLDGLRAIEVGFYTWSTVKMYYALFYAVRAILAWDNTAVFRIGGRTPFSIRAANGSLPEFIPGRGSHKSMLNCFRNRLPAHFLLSQPIEAVDGPAWLLEKREQANYAIPRFCEPGVPEHYEQIFRIGVRKAIVEYLNPSGSILTFDKDHAVVSYPLAALRSAADSAKLHGGAIIEPAEKQFLIKKCQERSAVLAPMMTFLRGSIRK